MMSTTSEALTVHLLFLFHLVQIKRMKKQLLLFIELLVSLIVIAVVLFLVELDKVLAVIANANHWFILAAFFAYFGINLGMGIRIRLILAEMGHKISPISALMANFAGMLTSDFTPARSGYFATAFALAANEKIPLGKAVVSILGPQLFEFMLKVCAGTIAIIYIFYYLNLGEGSFAGMFLGVIALASMLIFGILLLFSKRFLILLKPIEKLPFGEVAYSKLVGMQHHAIAIKKVVPAILILLVITWFLKGVEWYMLALSVGMQPNIQLNPLLFYMFLQPLITILQFIPTPTLAGIGLSEAGSIAVLSLFGVQPHVAAAYALLTRSLMILVDLIGVQEARKVIHKSLDHI